MTYIPEFDAELARRIDSGEDSEAIARWVSETILESYRNGITAGQNGARVIRQGKSRRRPLFPLRPALAASTFPLMISSPLG